MTKPIRIAIAGAGGRIGYSLVFRIANGGLFGHEQPVALSLLELPDALPRLEACAMELHDCAFPLLADLRFGSDPLRMFEGADWVILAGGKPFRPEVRVRFDLLRDNAPIMIDHGRAINQAAPAARVLVVINPSNTNYSDRHVAGAQRAAEPLVRTQPLSPHESDRRARGKGRRARQPDYSTDGLGEQQRERSRSTCGTRESVTSRLSMSSRTRTGFGTSSNPPSAIAGSRS